MGSDQKVPSIKHDVRSGARGADSLPAPPYKTLLDAAATDALIGKLAREIAERLGSEKRVAFVGIERGGVPTKNALRKALKTDKTEQGQYLDGTIDIGLYRDDAGLVLPSNKVGSSDIPFEVDGTDVVLVDDVLHTGRTIRAALDCLLDYGRPRRVWLAVLCDRGGRELPIAADFVGCTLDVSPKARVKVYFDDHDACSIIEEGGQG